MKKRYFIEPIAEHNFKKPFIPESSFIRALSVISPEFVYYYLNQIVTYGCAYVIGTGQYGTSTSAMFKENSLVWATIIRIIAVVLAVLPLIPSFLKEYVCIIPKEEKRIYHIVFTVITAIALSLFLNVIAYKTGFSSSSQSFDKTAANQFSLPIWIGILVYGLITPVTEEIVHRGIIYNRLRRFYELPIAIIMGGLIFGLSHGNVVQLVYGGLMGIMICCIYERYSTFVYPMLFHCMANTAVYVCMSIKPIREAVFSYPGMMIEAGAALVGIYFIFSGENH